MHASPAARRAALPLSALLLLGPAMIAAPASAAVLDGVSDLTTLVDAVDEANATPGADVIVIDPGSVIAGEGGGVAITDDLTIELSGSAVIDLRLLVLDADLTMRGGSWSALPAATASLVAPGIGVGEAASLLLDGMTVVASGSECDAAIGGWYSAPGGPEQCDGGQSIDGGTITIVDSTVTATGGLFSAGIGGGSRSQHGAISITRSTITATGGEFGAGIGAGKDRVAGAISLVDSTVSATGTRSGAGIGGSDRGTGGTVTIDGGVVTATGASTAAGIGGGFAGNGGSTTILGDAAVTANGGSLAAGIGGGIYGEGGSTNVGGTAVVIAGGRDGAPGIGSAFSAGRTHSTTITDGSPSLTTTGINGGLTVAAGAVLAPLTALSVDGDLSVAGELVLDAAVSVTVPAGRTLRNSGVIRGAGELRGAGAVENDGIICAPVRDIALSSAVPAEGLVVSGTVTQLRYALPGGGEQLEAVYAPTIDAGCRELPDASTDQRILIGWSLGVDGPLLMPTSELAQAAPSGAADLEPVLVDAVLTLVPSANPSTAGSVVSVQAFGPVPLSGELSTELTSALALAGDIVPGAVPAEFSATAVGTRTITGTVTVSGPAGERVLSGSYAHVTIPAALSALTVAPSAARVGQGGSVDLSVSGADAYGNAVPLDASTITVTSNVPTDVVDGLRVIFPTASPHTLTVTVGAVSAEVVIEVVPTPTALVPAPPTAAPVEGVPEPALIEPPLPATGSAGDLGGALLWAMLLLVAGGAAGLLRTRAD